MNYYSESEMLCSLLGCTPEELEIIQSTRDNFSEILLDLNNANRKPSFKSIMETVFDRAFLYFEDDLEELIKYFEQCEEQGSLDEEEQEELNTLKLFDPRTDIKILIWDSKISCYFEDCELFEQYEYYIKDILEDFEYRTGYCPQY